MTLAALMTTHIDEITPQKGERAVIIGGSRSGKSVLGDHIEQNMIRQRPGLEEIVLDTKPRFRAELERFGPGLRAVRSADRHYKDWEKGPTIPGSYRHPLDTDDLSKYWQPKDGCRTVILQTDSEELRPRLLEISNGWFEKRKRNADRLLRVNELLDFYYANGVCVSSRNNVPLKVHRAGGERGFSSLYESQRVRGMPTQLIEEMSWLYLFYFKYKKDMAFLWENGIPTHVMPPTEKHVFRALRTEPGGFVEDLGLHRLTPSPEYLAQLSDT